MATCAYDGEGEDKECPRDTIVGKRALSKSRFISIIGRTVY